MPLASCASLSAIWAKTGRPRLCLTVPPVRRLPRAPLVLPALLAIATRQQQLASEAPPRVPRHVRRVVTHTPAPFGPRPPRPACQPKTQAATAPSAAARSGRRPSPGSASERRCTVRPHAWYTREARRASRALRSSLEVFGLDAHAAEYRWFAPGRPVVVTYQSQSKSERIRQAGREGGASRQAALL